MNRRPYIFIIIFVLSSVWSLSISQAKINRTKEARAWVKRGQEALKDGALREALLAFESAERYHSSLNHKMMIAKVYEAMPKHEGCLRAISTWHSVLKELKTQNSSLVPKAQNKIQVLEKSCTRKLSVTTKPTGAKVWIDDELVGFSPIIISVKSDTSRISAEYDHHKQSKTLDSKDTDIAFDFSATQRQIIQSNVTADHQIKTVSNTNTTNNHTVKPINFQAILKCRALVDQSYEDLSSCQSRALWEGDQFKLTFESDQPVYLYVFLSNSTGQRQTLFPRGSAKNLLPAGHKSDLPLGNWFTLDEVGPVTEKIYVVYARNMVPSFEALRTLNTPSEKESVSVKTLAMSSVRGVVLPREAGSLKLTVSNTLDDQSHFIGRDEVNRVEFELFHQGARPK